MREFVASVGLVFWVLLVTVVFVFLVASLELAVLPWWENQHREITQHTNQYVQSKVTELVDSYAQYMDLETRKALYTDPTIKTSITGQQKALVNRMCNAYQLIPDDVDDVPDYIVDFMKEQNCG